MIFYTLQGPTFKLVIHEDKICLVKKPWAHLFSKTEVQDTFAINELSKFEITAPKFLFFSGKLHWETFNGQTGTFSFTTHPLMMKKIETYLQKRVLKNHAKKITIKNLSPKPRKKKHLIKNSAA